MDFNDAGLAADLSSSSSAANPLYQTLPGYMSDFDVFPRDPTTANVTIRKHQNPNSTGRFLGTTAEWDSLGGSTDDGYTFATNTALRWIVHTLPGLGPTVSTSPLR